MPKKLTKETFIQRSINIHGVLYDYSKVDYKNNQKPVEIICPKHTVFWLAPCSHFKGRGCPICSGYKISTKEFIEKAKALHGNKYDYSFVNYTGIFNKIKIFCNIHGEFQQTPDRHLNSNGCLLCGIKISSDKKRYSTIDFIEKAKKVHGNKYDYSLVKYNHSKDNVVIVCPEHGKFEQTPNAHWIGKGCIRCNESKGEKQIEKLLLKNNILFEAQKKFDKCKKHNYLPFDFYLPEYNICIEYDGEQHYKVVEWFGGEKSFKQTQVNDKFKTEFCKKNNIILFRIKYNQNIKEKIKELIKLFNK